MAASLTLDIGEDRLLLETRSSVYHLDIYLPFFLHQYDCAAQFNRRTKVAVVGSHWLTVIRPHRMHGVQRCGLLLQM